MLKKSVVHFHVSVTFFYNTNFLFKLILCLCQNGHKNNPLLIFFQKTDGYSGSDIKLVCKETAMQAMRLVFDTLENKSKSNNNNLHFTIMTKDVENSITKIKPSTSATDNNKYEVWHSQYESY